MLTQAPTLGLSILVHFALSIVSCQADQIKVPATDHRVNQYPPERHGWIWRSECGQFISTSAGEGNNVSFSFVGTAVTVNFIADVFAGLAQIALDGLNRITVDTHNKSVQDTRDCAPVSWSSGNLPSGHHTVALYPLKDSMDVHNFVYTGEPVSSTLALPKSTQTFQSGRSSYLRNEIRVIAIIIPATMAVRRSSVYRILPRRTQLSATTAPLPLPVPWRPHRWGAMQNSPTGLARCGNACILSAIAVAAASLCAYALNESQPFGPIESAQLSTLLLQLAGLLPQIGISMLAYECLHMGIAAGLNGEGLALGLLDSAANGLEVTSLLLRPSALRHKGSVVRIIAITIGIIAGLLRFTLAVYPLLPGGIDGSQANAIFTLIGEQVAACPSCGGLTSYLRIANSITAVGSATFRTNFTQQGDALIIPPFVYDIDSAGPSVETEQDTLKLSLCQHTNLTKPIARVGDMEFTKEYGRTVFGLADGVFRFSMAFGENYSSPSYTTMECQAQLTRYKYIQDVNNGGPIQIIHELNSSALPVYNLSWPGFSSYVYGDDLQLEYFNNKVVGTRDFIGIMVSMLGGTRLLDYNITLTAGRQVGQFRLNALAVILLTSTSVGAWTVAAGLLLWFTYRADCIATAADSGLLTAARHGPELGQLLQGGCNGEIPLESALTAVRARRVGSHVEIPSTRGEKVTEEQLLA